MQINIKNIQTLPNDLGDGYYTVDELIENFGLNTPTQILHTTRSSGRWIYGKETKYTKSKNIKGVYLASENGVKIGLDDVFGNNTNNPDISQYLHHLGGYAMVVVESDTYKHIKTVKGNAADEVGPWPYIELPSTPRALTVYFVANFEIVHRGTYEVYDRSHVCTAYDIAVVSNAAPKTDLTIKSVVNSILETAEPIRKGENPRYTFADEDAEKYRNTPCAEFNFANGMTLREILEEIAGSVNAIPRLKNGKIYFEELGRNDEVNKQYLGTPISSTHIATVEKYASHLDSVVNGLMNMDNEQQGAIADPMLGGFKTLRSEATRIINIS